MTRLERYQISVYFTALFLGLVLGVFFPALASGLEAALWPLVGVLLYVTFLQVPLLEFRQALSDVRFFAALLTANFVFVPLVVWGLLWGLPASAPIHLGVALVLLTPCTDWMNTFTLLGQGDAQRTLAATPLLLVVQIVLLPLFLWLLLDSDVSQMVATAPFWQAFFGLVMLPLALAWLTEWQGRRSRGFVAWLSMSRPLSVLLLALVVCVIAASQIRSVLDHLRHLSQVTLIFVLYVALAVVIGKLTIRLYRLPPRAGRGLIFSVGTRNSFVVLPLALALPAEWQLAVSVIVVQAFVEMVGMLVLIRLAPSCLVREPPG